MMWSNLSFAWIELTEKAARLDGSYGVRFEE
ncbi:hypothetical protein J2855_002704 [Agrobacterium tumefaciens]|nr:hypothetical protein [Agrobacterium tumefaciens]MBP2518210.1 hypothetical protein [Agrobacterium tumefaciens]MBP2573413.1 hypothetical protein [Agrobacterium tumefaciens]MBP2576843.1 hypothetical protein [Agrobacterium tumefaciens]MBP2594975.1 hypothetical protein [Agrobacterium tumefaciens]